MRTVKGFAKAIKTTTFVVLLQNDLSHFERLLSMFFVVGFLKHLNDTD